MAQERDTSPDYKSENKNELEQAFDELLKTIETRRIDNQINVTSERIKVNITMKTGDVISAEMEITGELHLGNHKEGEMHTILSEEGTGKKIAYRDYTIYSLGKGKSTVHTLSFVKVDNLYSRLGVGGNLIDHDEEVLRELGKKFNAHTKISEIVMHVSDTTKGKDLLWTTNQFEGREGWEKVDQGEYIEYVKSIPITASPMDMTQRVRGETSR